MVAQPGSAGCSEGALVPQSGSIGCSEGTLFALPGSYIALAKVVINKLLRKNREPSQVALL